MKHKTSIEIVKNWLVETVIGLNLCPFAKKPYEEGKINIAVSKAQNFESAYDDFIKEIELISSNSITTTSLLAFDCLETNFLDFNDFIGSLENILAENDLSDDFQLVCFHQGFYFGGLELNDLANYVNRSPMPLVHILRRSDVTKASSSIDTGVNISFNNENLIKSLSDQELKKHFWFLY